MMRGNFLLHRYAAEGDVDLCSQLLQHQVDVNLCDQAGLTPLHYAVMCGQMYTSELLLSNGADANAVAKNGCTAFHYAVSGARYHLSADNGSMKLEIAKDSHVCEDDDGVALGMVDVLLRHGADACSITQRHMSALHIAARSCAALCDRLLLAGCPIAAVTKDMWTPLHEACSHNALAVVQLLIDRGADVNACTLRGVTPLHEAARRASAGVCQLLVAAGAGVNARTQRGATPLYLGAAANETEVCTFLLSANADPSALTQDGSSALQMAERHGNEVLASMLRPR